MDALRREPAEIREAVRKHTETLHNRGKISSVGVARMRAQLEPAALAHFQNMLDLLERQYTAQAQSASETTRVRLEKLRQSVAFVREKGNT